MRPARSMVTGAAVSATSRIGAPGRRRYASAWPTAPADGPTTRGWLGCLLVQAPTASPAVVTVAATKNWRRERGAVGTIAGSPIGCTSGHTEGSAVARVAGLEPDRHHGRDQRDQHAEVGEQVAKGRLAA